jgi:hypothetical protein
MDLSFLWNWLTPAEWDAAIRACFTGIGLSEVIKRGAKLGGTSMSALSMWTLSIAVTALAAALYTLRAAGVATIAALTLTQWIDLVLFAILVGPFAPLMHWLVLLKGADFASWLIEKRTGYQVNLRELASGSSYRLKRVKLKDGTEAEVPENTSPDQYDHTVVTRPPAAPVEEPKP